MLPQSNNVRTTNKMADKEAYVTYRRVTYDFSVITVIYGSRTSGAKHG